MKNVGLILFLRGFAASRESVLGVWALGPKGMFLSLLILIGQIQSGLFGGYLNVLVEQIAHYSVMPQKGSRRSADPIDGYRQEASFLMTIV